MEAESATMWTILEPIRNDLFVCSIEMYFFVRMGIGTRDIRIVVYAESEWAKHATNYYYYRSINPQWWLYPCVQPPCHFIPVRCALNIFRLIFRAVPNPCGRSRIEPTVMHIEFQYCVFLKMHYIFMLCHAMRQRPSGRPSVICRQQKQKLHIILTSNFIFVFELRRTVYECSRIEFTSISRRENISK